MIAKILPIFVLLVASHQASMDPKPEETPKDLPKPQLPSPAPAPAPGPAPAPPPHPEDKEKPMTGVDPDTLTCDPNGMVFLLLPHFHDCSKFFMCVHGQEVEFDCAPGGLVFDFELQTCNWAWATECKLRTPPEDEIEGSGEDSFNWLTDKAEAQSAAVGSLTGDAVANSVRPMSLETRANLNSPINCMRLDSAARLIAYKGDCQRYWHCVNGVAKSAYCSDGLYFNELTQQCDFEANVKCMVEQEDELKSEFILHK